MAGRGRTWTRVGGRGQKAAECWWALDLALSALGHWPCGNYGDDSEALFNGFHPRRPLKGGMAHGCSGAFISQHFSTRVTTCAGDASHPECSVQRHDGGGPAPGLLLPALACVAGWRPAGHAPWSLLPDLCGVWSQLCWGRRITEPLSSKATEVPLNACLFCRKCGLGDGYFQT